MPSWTPLTDGVPVLIPDGNNGDVFYYSMPIVALRAYDIVLSAGTNVSTFMEYAIDDDSGAAIAGSYNPTPDQANSYLCDRAGTLYIMVNATEDGFSGFHLGVTSYVPQNLVLGYSLPVGDITAGTTKFFNIPAQPPGVARGIKLQLSGGTGDGDLGASYTALNDLYNESITLYAGDTDENDEVLQLYQPAGAPIRVGVVSFDPPSSGASLALKLADEPTGYWAGYTLPNNSDSIRWFWAKTVDTGRVFVFGYGTSHAWIASTIDFVSWNLSQLPAAGNGATMQWFSAAWSGTELCAVGFVYGNITGYSITTTDAAALTTQTLPMTSSNSAWGDVAWGAGKFVAISMMRVFATLSGSTWTTNPWPASPGTVNNGSRIAFDGTHFVVRAMAITGSGVGYIFNSTDGTSWNLLTPNTIKPSGTTSDTGIDVSMRVFAGGDGYVIADNIYPYITYDHGQNWYAFENRIEFFQTQARSFSAGPVSGVYPGSAASTVAPLFVQTVMNYADDPVDTDYTFTFPRFGLYDLTGKVIPGPTVLHEPMLDYLPGEEFQRYQFYTVNDVATSRTFFHGTQPAYVGPTTLYIYNTYKPSFWTGFEKSLDQ